MVKFKTIKHQKYITKEENSKSETKMLSKINDLNKKINTNLFLSVFINLIIIMTIIIIIYIVIKRMTSQQLEQLRNKMRYVITTYKNMIYEAIDEASGKTFRYKPTNEHLKQK